MPKTSKIDAKKFRPRRRKFKGIRIPYYALKQGFLGLCIVAVIGWLYLKLFI